MTISILAPALGNPASSSFRKETSHVIAKLRSSLIDLVSHIAPKDESSNGPLKSRDIQRILGVDFKLSWKIYRIVNFDDPIEICQYIPSSVVMRKLLRAATEHRAPKKAVNATATAFLEFEQHVERHARDRVSFDLMIARMLGGEANAQTELFHRKMAFEADRYVWGVEMETYLRSLILHPSLTTPTTIDFTHLRAKVNLSRLSSDAAICVDRQRIGTPDEAAPGVRSEPLDADALKKYGVPILPQFCTDADVNLRRSRDMDGAMTTEWLGDSIGRISEVDLTFGEVHRNFPLDVHPNGLTGFTSGTTFAAPMRTFILDFIIHRPTFGTMTHEVTRWGHAVEYPRKVDPPEAMGLPKLSCHDRMTFLGSGLLAAQTRDVPRYVELLRFTCETLHWNLEEMDVYRLRTEYPLMDTALLTQILFPERRVPPAP